MPSDLIRGWGPVRNASNRNLARLLLRRDEGRADGADLVLVGGRSGRLGRGGCRSRCRGGAGRRCAFLGRWRRALRLRALLHPPRALLGDDDVALFDAGPVVDRLQRFRPGLACGLAGAGRVELGAEFERVGQRRVGLAIDRDRLVDVLAGVAVGEQRGFRRRARRLAGPLVVLKSLLVGGERHREITAVAGADADGAEGAGRRAEVGAGRRQRLVVAEQAVDEVAGTARGGGILRAAIVLRERRQHRAALVFAVGAADAAAAQALQARGDLVEIGAHLLNLGVDRAALRRAAVEQREEARAFAAHPLGLLRDPIKFALLLGLGLLIAADLFILGGVAGAGATVDGRQLSFEPHADRIALRALLWWG